MSEVGVLGNRDVHLPLTFLHAVSGGSLGVCDSPVMKVGMEIDTWVEATQCPDTI